MHLHLDHNLQLAETHIEAKLGDHLPLTLHYYTHDGTPYLPPISGIILAAKLPEQYNQNNFILYNDTWTPDHQNKTLTGTLKLNTQTLANLLENNPFIDLHAEIEHSAPGWKNTTLQPLHIRIYNDIIKNNETITPDDTTPDYVTKPYVDQTIANNLQQGFAHHLETLETLKTAAQTHATQATTQATHSQTHATTAANSATTATTQAQNATQQATTAKQASTTATQAATLATSAATQAKNSITTIDQYTLTAQAAAQNAQNIANTLGDEVTQAKQAAKQAAASATQAQNATAGIDENVKRVEQATHTVADDLATVKRNKEAIDSATKNIETDRKQVAENTTKTIEAATKAEQGATTASTKATEAAASATTATTKATAAGTSATNAANSATTAQTHATTAQTHATTAQTHATTAGTKATEASGSATSAASSATQAGTARDAAVTAKTAAEAAADRAEAASGGGVTEAQVNAKISSHDTSTTAHAAELAKKLDKPTGGTPGQVLTKTASGSAWSDATGGGSAFDDVFEVGYQGGADVNISTKDTNKPIILTSTAGWHILSDGRIYLCSYGDDLDMCGNGVNIGTNNYSVLQATSGGSVTISARTSLNLVDASGSFALGDIARTGDVYFSENGLNMWDTQTLPAGWYKVDVLLFSPAAVSVGKLMLASAIQAGRIKSVQGIAFGGSGSSYCYFNTSSTWSGGGGGTISCNIMRLSFAYKHVPANGVDWMVLSDLNKFYGGSVRYKAIHTPQNI